MAEHPHTCPSSPPGEIHREGRGGQRKKWAGSHGQYSLSLRGCWGKATKRISEERSEGKWQGSPTRIAWITKEAIGRGNRILRETCEEKTSLAHLSCQIEAPQQFSQEGAHIGS